MKGNCEYLDAQIKDYLAGELSDADAAILEDHAGGCERCWMLLETRTRLAQRLADQIIPPVDLREATLSRLEPVGLRPSRARWLVPPAIAAALVLAFGLTQTRSKEAMTHRMQSRGEYAVAQSHALPVLDQIDSAREEVAAKIAREPEAQGVSRLRSRLRSLEDQADRLRALMEEFKS